MPSWQLTVSYRGVLTPSSFWTWICNVVTPLDKNAAKICYDDSVCPWMICRAICRRPGTRRLRHTWRWWKSQSSGSAATKSLAYWYSFTQVLSRQPSHHLSGGSISTQALEPMQSCLQLHTRDLGKTDLGLTG